MFVRSFVRSFILYATTTTYVCVCVCASLLAYIHARAVHVYMYAYDEHLLCLLYVRMCICAAFFYDLKKAVFFLNLSKLRVVYIRDESSNYFDVMI